MDTEAMEVLEENPFSEVRAKLMAAIADNKGSRGATVLGDKESLPENWQRLAAEMALCWVDGNGKINFICGVIDV